MMLYKSRGLVQPFLADFLCSLRALNRRCELQRLVAWAEGKRLERPLRLYRDRLREEDARLLRYRIHAPCAGHTGHIPSLMRSSRRRASITQEPQAAIAVQLTETQIPPIV